MNPTYFLQSSLEKSKWINFDFENYPESTYWKLSQSNYFTNSNFFFLNENKSNLTFQFQWLIPYNLVDGHLSLESVEKKCSIA